MDNQFWLGKKVLLTGHTGFKGSWLSIWLKYLGADVTGFALEPPTDPNMFSLTGISNNINSVLGDIRDKSLLLNVMQTAQPEIVIHMAAQPLVRYSYEHPLETYETNVMGTAYVMDAIRFVQSVKSVVIVTTDKCYDNQEWVWGYRENDPLGGYDPYSNSKACAELVTAAFRNSYFHPTKYTDHGVAVATVRAGNVIGGGDWAMDRLVPDIIRSITNQEEILIRHPLATRPWQHVLEPLYGYLLLAEKLCKNGDEYAEAWNFGPEESSEKNVQWVVENLLSLWGTDIKLILAEGEKVHEANYLKLDSSKAKGRLKWYPKLDIETSLIKTVEWYKAAINEQDMSHFSIQQIEEYMNY